MFNYIIKFWAKKNKNINYMNIRLIELNINE